jgi:hypothetical protein
MAIIIGAPMTQERAPASPPKREKARRASRPELRPSPRKASEPRMDPAMRKRRYPYLSAAIPMGRPKTRMTTEGRPFRSPMKS